MRYILAVLLLSSLVACDERFRYPCQDPENWDDKQCKKPFCSANGTCPEDLSHYEKQNLTINDKGTPVYKSTPAPQNTSKGDCK